jgi:hypothetical protein
MGIIEQAILTLTDGMNDPPRVIRKNEGVATPLYTHHLLALELLSSISSVPFPHHEKTERPRSC